MRRHLQDARSCAARLDNRASAGRHVGSRSSPSPARRSGRGHRGRGPALDRDHAHHVGGAPAYGADVAPLDKVSAPRGTGPAEFIADRGGPCASDQVAGWCALHGVVHHSIPQRTPEHKARSEHGRRELEEETELGKVALQHELREALVHPARATLQVGRRRSSPGMGRWPPRSMTNRYPGPKSWIASTCLRQYLAQWKSPSWNLGRNQSSVAMLAPLPLKVGIPLILHEPRVGTREQFLKQHTWLILRHS